MRSPKRANILAVLLIVLGVGATLAGLYGQLILTDDDGHHDDREPTFALDSRIGVDELTVVSPGPNRIEIELARAGQPLRLDTLHGAGGHVFVVSADRSSFEHRIVAPDSVTSTDLLAMKDVPSGELRVVAQVAVAGGPDLLELGSTVEVDGETLPGPDITDDDEWTNGSLTVTRQGFDFVLSEPWSGDDVYDGPALLTLFRAEDFAFTHAHAEVVGDNRFSFATDLPGLGDYLAALEFEQDGELVTALFRFTL